MSDQSPLDENSTTASSTDSIAEANSRENHAANAIQRAINFEHSKQFVPVLQHLKSSLLVSTYAAGKVATIGTGPEGLRLEFPNFRHAMGLAIGPRYLAVGGQNIIWLLQSGHELAQQMEPAGRYDACYLARESFVTGNIHSHELAWGNQDRLWVVNTLFSCLCNLHEDFNFVPAWKPPFITEFAAQDRCHLNGLVMQDGEPKFVSALGTSNEPNGWRAGKANGGVLMEVPSGEVVASGFCMPHSPRLYNGQLFMLDSGRGHLVKVDLQSGKFEPIESLPGYARGMAFHGQFAFIGLSKARETSVFGGVPICEDRPKMRCGVVVVDMNSGQSVASLEFKTGVEEIFDVKVLPNVTMPVISGPYPQEDDQAPVWVVPRPETAERIIASSTDGSVARKQPAT